jgi:hypothetical protein
MRQRHYVISAILAAALAATTAAPAPANGGPRATAGSAGTAGTAGTATVLAPPAGPTVSYYGRAGTFGSLGGRLASGQEIRLNAVPNLGMSPGRKFYVTEVAADGMVFTGGLDHRGGFGAKGDETGDTMEIGSLDPATNSYRNIGITSSTGRSTYTYPDGRPGGAAIGDLEAIRGGQGVAFIAPVAYRQQDPSTDGVWPVFGILSKVGGSWQVASGAGWRNQWTGGELRQTTFSPNPGAAQRACPQDGGIPTAPQSHCRMLNEMASLPTSGDIVVAQYGGSITSIRPGAPDTSGRYRPVVTGHFPYPAIKDTTTPADPDDNLAIAVREIQADPTGTSGNERFTVTFDAWTNRPIPGMPGWYYPATAVVQEFRYDAATGDIAPVSPPILPGDALSNGVLWGYSTNIYDHLGNLWVPRAEGYGAGSLAVYAKEGGQHRYNGSACEWDPARNLSDYRTTGPDGMQVWGQACAPNYDILQNREHNNAFGLVQDPATRDIVQLTTTGKLLAIRPSGSGATGMTFRVGAPVELDLGLLSWAPGSLPDYRLAATVDSSHRVWVSVMHGIPDGVRHTTDQWLVSADVGDLFDPEPLVLPHGAGWYNTIQAENSLTTTTTQTTPPGGTRLVDSHNHNQHCFSWTSEPDGECADDGLVGTGFYVPDRGRTHEYKIEVPTAGRYRIAYWAQSPAGTTTGRIQLTANGTTHTTAIDTGGTWTSVAGPDVDLRAGPQTISVRAPSASEGGWSLSWLLLTRL